MNEIINTIQLAAFNCKALEKGRKFNFILQLSWKTLHNGTIAQSKLCLKNIDAQNADSNERILSNFATKCMQ